MISFVKKNYIELLWGSLYFLGGGWFLKNELIDDPLENPILLSHISVLLGWVVSFSFIFKNRIADNILKNLFFPVFSVSICIIVGRMLFDFDASGPWILEYRKVAADYAKPETYRIADFLFHYLYPIGYANLFKNNHTRMTRIFYNKSIRYILVQYILPSIGFLLWMLAMIFIEHKSFNEIYYTKNIHFMQVFLITLFVPLALTLPLQISMVHKKDKMDFNPYYKGLILTGCLLICLLSLFIYKPISLHENIIFISSFAISILLSLRLLTVFSDEKYFVILPVILSVNIFSFFINEFHFWSTGGTEDVYILNLWDIASPVSIGLHYVIKTIYYAINIIGFYIYYCFLDQKVLYDRIGKIPHYFLKLIFFNIVIFGLLFSIGVFDRYDLKNTHLDYLYFILGMILSIELTLPLRQMTLLKLKLKK